MGHMAGVRDLGAPCVRFFCSTLKWGVRQAEAQGEGKKEKVKMRKAEGTRFEKRGTGGRIRDQGGREDLLIRNTK